MEKLLVTGADGFIGSHLVDHFLEVGHQVVRLDDLSTRLSKYYIGQVGLKKTLNTISITQTSLSLKTTSAT